jgi:hypothetical protein
MSKAAFPIHRATVQEGTIYAASMVVDDGMTLRDYFAAKAMQGMMVDVEDPRCDYIAKVSYKIADAMLKARAS